MGHGARLREKSACSQQNLKELEICRVLSTSDMEMQNLEFVLLELGLSLVWHFLSRHPLFPFGMVMHILIPLYVGAMRAAS